NNRTRPPQVVQSFAALRRFQKTAGRHNASSKLQSEHEQHGLVSHFAKFRRIFELVLGNPAKPRQDCDILLAADLERHWRRVEADSDIDLPKLLQADIVISSKGSIDEAREEEATRGREGCAVIWIGFVQLFLDLAVERIDDDNVGFVSLDILWHTAQYCSVGVPASIGIECCLIA